MSNVAPLFESINTMQEPNQQLIDALNSLVAMAESGQLQSYIGTGFTQDGLRVSTWCDFHDDVYQMLGSLEWIKAEYVKRRSE